MAATVAVAVGSVVVKDTQMDLPPGFRFHPTDEELVTYYLVNKVATSTFKPHAIAEVDLNRCEPWDLPGKAQMGEKEWYFFSLRDRKYPTGMRTNRATDKGYWKATGKDRDVMKAGSLVGMKKTLVFYRGRAPRGEKTNWIMHEYRLERDGLGIVAAMRPHKASPKDEWVVCRIFQKNSGGKKSTNDAMLDHYGEPTSPLNDQPDLDEDGMTNNSMSPYPNRVTSFGQLVPSPKTQKDVTLHEINSFTSTMGMNVRGYNPGYPSSSFPATNNTATLSPTTGPLSSDMSSTMASNYNDMSAAGLGNLSVPQGFSGQFGYLNQLLVQGQGQGTHLGMLRPCKQEPAYIPMNTLGEDEAHSGRTSSPGILLDHSISPTSQGWIPTANDGLQQHHHQQHQQHLYGAELPPARLGLHNNRQHITPEHLAVVFPESSCVTEVVNDHHFRHITGSRYLADASGAVGVGDMPDWNFVAAAS